MDFTNIMAKLEMVEHTATDLAQLRREIEALQLMVIEMKLAQESKAGSQVRTQLALADDAPAFDHDDHLRCRIEDVVSARIRGWMYAQHTDGAWRSPLTASQVAEALGDSTRWQEVKALMRSPGWDRLSWYKAAPPSNWRAGARDSKLIQWVMVRGAS